MIMRSPTARMIRPFLKQWARHIMPTPRSGSKVARVALSFTSTSPATKPQVSATPTSGWSLSSAKRSARYGPVSSRTRPTRFSRSISSMLASATAQATGWPL
ncbi:hypothetical protein FQZ97_1276000 [compost metagenome]